MNSKLYLADWRRQITEIYANVRHNPNVEAAWHTFRKRRDRLFTAHVQSPLVQAQKATFNRLPYFAYNPAWRVTGTIDTNIEPETQPVHLPADGQFNTTRIARIHFQIQGVRGSLSVFWIEAYGGGVFLPFKDATNGQTTYSGGRYLFDSIKGADLNIKPDEFILDFNFAYNPSCAYNNRWHCPLSPPENRLPFAVTAGEKSFNQEG